MKKNTEKRQKFIENNRRVVNSIGYIITIFFALGIVGRLLHFIFLILREFIPKVMSFEQLKAGLFVIGLIFVSYLIAKFLFGGGLEND